MVVVIERAAKVHLESADGYLNHSLRALYCTDQKMDCSQFLSPLSQQRCSYRTPNPLLAIFPFKFLFASRTAK